MQGFDISFLLTNFNLENMYKHKLVDFVVQFMEEIDSEVSPRTPALTSGDEWCEVRGQATAAAARPPPPPPYPGADLGDEDPGQRARAHDRFPVSQGVLHMMALGAEGIAVGAPSPPAVAPP